MVSPWWRRRRPAPDHIAVVGDPAGADVLGLGPRLLLRLRLGLGLGLAGGLGQRLRLLAVERVRLVERARLGRRQRVLAALRLAPGLGVRGGRDTAVLGLKE